MISNLQYLTRIASATLLNGIAWGVGLALFAHIVFRLVRGHSSSTRFVVWYSVLFLIVLLPFFDFAVVRGTSNPAAEITIPATWAFYFFSGWVLLAAIGLLRVAAGLWQIQKLRRTAMPLANPELAALLQKTAQKFSNRRPVKILSSEEVSVPTALGFFRPTVLIPNWAVKELPASDLNALVLHELAHLRRWDDWSNLLQKIVGAILFFHPAVWWIENRLALEREMACDDLVLAATGNPRAYAQCLVNIAERSLLRRSLAMAHAAVGRLRQTSLRVSQILNSRRCIATAVWKPSLVVVMAGALATVAGVQHLPRLVAFSTQPSQVAREAAPPSDVDYAALQTRVTPASTQHDLLATRPKPVPTTWQTEHHQTALSVKTKAAARTKPLLVRAELKASEDVKPPDVFLVVMRSEQNNASGTIWSISVYRLTVFHPTKQQIRNETPAKNI